MRTKTYMLFMGVIMLFSSCQDWLDVGSETELLENDVYSSDEGFHKALTGIYLGMGSSSLYGSELTWRMLEYYAQYYERITGSDDQNLSTYSYTNTAVAARIEKIWNGLYNLIGRCNDILEHLEEQKASLNPMSYQIVKGEALALRAFFHFDLMRLFGHGNLRNRTDINTATKLTIPYVTEFTKEITPQRSYDETFAMMKADLREAIELLWGENGENCFQWIYEDENWEDLYEPLYEAANGDTRYYFTYQDYADKPRVDYYVAKAILARVLMWEGTDEGYAEAYNIANEWFDAENDSQPDAWDWHSQWRLNTSSASSRDRIFNNENVWTLNVNNLYSLMGNGTWFKVSTQYDKCQLTQTVGNEIYEYETGNYTGTSDWRRIYLLTVSGTRYQIEKLDQMDGNENFSKKNRIPMIGTPEMYYMAAEAVAEGCVSGKTLKDAVELLNTVRSHRGMTADDMQLAEDLDYQSVKKEIMKEARKEFLCLGQMFYFYKRTGETVLFGNESVEMTDLQYVLPYPDSEVINGNRIQ